MRSFLSERYGIALFTTTFIALFVTLYFGLKPKGYDFTNHVSWLENRPGVHFGRFGLLYASLEQQLAGELSASKGFSVEIALQPQSSDAWRFKMIMTITDGNDQTQFMIGQWKSSVIIMNGNDYINNHNSWRINQEIAHEPGRETLLALTTGVGGTRLYLDGIQVWFKPDAALTLPHKGNVSLTLGNDVYGRHPWPGNVFGLALYEQELPATTIRSHFNNWLTRREFTVSSDEQPALYYLFKEKAGKTASNLGKRREPLIFPQTVTVLKRRAFSPPLPYLGTMTSLLEDSAMNFFGFIPLGFFLAACFSAIGRPMRESVGYSVAICLGLSMGIEYLQSWMPSRVSQSLDVILNTLGALTGAISGWIIPLNLDYFPRYK